MVKIAVDMMGSDLGPSELIKGVKSFLENREDASVVLFGNVDELKELSENSRVEIVNTTQVVPMEISPLEFLRMKDSSMRQAIARTASDETVSGVVSSGSTGGFITGCQLILKNIPGVVRSGLTSPFPTENPDKQAVILDIGASNYNTGEELVCFAKLGYLYAKHVLNYSDPKVYLLSNGTEKGKGLDETIKADEILTETAFQGYAGRCEARDALDGKHDVIVTTGYSGNILLKSMEGAARMMGHLMKKAFKKNLATKMGYLLCQSGIKDMMKIMDSKRLGGAMLLGVSKVAVKSHGNSNDYAFMNALDLAYRMSKSDFIPSIKKEFGNEG